MLYFSHGEFQPADDVLRVGEEADACGGESYCPGGPVEQLGSQLVLQRVYLA